jgi:hypothetical protein
MSRTWTRTFEMWRIKILHIKMLRIEMLQIEMWRIEILRIHSRGPSIEAVATNGPEHRTPYRGTSLIAHFFPLRSYSRTAHNTRFAVLSYLRTAHHTRFDVPNYVRTADHTPQNGLSFKSSDPCTVQFRTTRGWLPQQTHACFWVFLQQETRERINS